MRPIGWFSAALLAALLGGCPKPGTPGHEVRVSVRVLDEAGVPIETAVVRHTEEKERHPVNTVTGAWTAAGLYLPGGAYVAFVPGQELAFEVSAPGYQTEKVLYVVRRRANLVDVVLCPQAPDVEEMPDPQIRFGRDLPREGAPPEECPDEP